MTRRRVVVTGLGIVSPVGSTVASAWEAICAGRSGIGPITRFDVSAFATRFGGSVHGFQIEEYLTPKEARKMDPFMHYGFGAAVQAIKDANLEVTAANAQRIGVDMGAGIGGNLKITRIDGVALGAAIEVNVPFNASLSRNLIANAGIGVFWSLSTTTNVNAALTNAGKTFTVGATQAEVFRNDTLLAISEPTRASCKNRRCDSASDARSRCMTLSARRFPVESCSAT